MRNIALYGGAFDPPHCGHLRIIESLCKAPLINEVWLVPCGDRQDKELLIPSKLRFQILKKLFKDKSQIRVSQAEIEMSKQRGCQIQTYDMLKQFKKRNSQLKFHFVIGADLLQSIHSWGDSQKLLKEQHFIVFNRKGYELDKSKLPLNSLIIENQPVEISSTYLKQIMRDKSLNSKQKSQLLEPWVSESVLSLLKENQLI